MAENHSRRIRFGNRTKILAIVVIGLIARDWVAAVSAVAQTNIAFSAKPTGPTTGNATVQGAGPRSGANGQNFFNLEGSDNNAFASFGVIDIDLSPLFLGGNPYSTVTGATLTLAENNAAFSHPGSYSVYLTNQTGVDISSTNTNLKAITTNNGAAMVDVNNLLTPLSTALGSDAFTTTGNVNNGQLHTVSLNFTGGSLTSIINALNSGGKLRLVLTPDTHDTVATFSGWSNTTAGRPGPVLSFTGGLTGANWDTNGAGGGLGGTGNWNNSTTNFNDSTGTGTPLAYDPSKLTIFGGTGGTVTIDQSPSGVVENGGLLFASDGYTVQGSKLTLGTVNKLFVANAGQTATINSQVSGSNGLSVSGLGTLVLGSGANDFSSGTSSTAISVNSATLQISSDANLGNTSNGVVLNGGATLKVRPVGSFTMSSGRALSGTGGAIDVGDGNTANINGQVTLGGTLTLANNNETVNLTNAITGVNGLVFSGTGTVQANTALVVGSGSIIANAVSGTATIQAPSVLFGFDTSNSSGTATGLGATFTVTNPGATLAITGPMDTTSMTAGNRIVVNGAGTIDLPHSQTTTFNKALQIGSATAAGPTLNIYSANNLGGNATDQTFFNSGTINNLSGGSLPVSNNVRFSIGGTSGFESKFAGGDMTFAGAISIFRPTTGTVNISIPTGMNVGFTGGWVTTNQGGTGITTQIGDSGTFANTSGFVVTGGGTMNLSAATGNFNLLTVPMTADGATINFNGVDPNANGAVITNIGTSPAVTLTTTLGLNAINKGRITLQAANAFGGGASPSTANAAKVSVGNGGAVSSGGLNQTFNTLAVNGYGVFDLGSTASASV